jgi:hypothetical protein
MVALIKPEFGLTVAPLGVLDVPVARLVASTVVPSGQVYWRKSVGRGRLTSLHRCDWLLCTPLAYT